MVNNTTYSRHTMQKLKFSIKDFFRKCDHIPQFPADLVTLTVKILNGKDDLKHLRASVNT